MEVLDLNNHNGLDQNRDNASCTTSSTGLWRGTGQPIPPGSPLPPSLQACWSDREFPVLYTVKALTITDDCQRLVSFPLLAMWRPARYVPTMNLFRRARVPAEMQALGRRIT